MALGHGIKTELGVGAALAPALVFVRLRSTPTVHEAFPLRLKEPHYSTLDVIIGRHPPEPRGQLININTGRGRSMSRMSLTSSRACCSLA